MKNNKFKNCEYTEFEFKYQCIGNGEQFALYHAKKRCELDNNSARILDCLTASYLVQNFDENYAKNVFEKYIYFAG
jgi:hypothetical protein